MSHTFWGLKIEPKASRKVAVPQNHVLHITHAAVERPLESEDVSGRLAIRCKSARSPLKFVICTLSDTQDQVNLNLKFSTQKAKSGPPSTSAIGGRKAKSAQPQNSQSSKGKYVKKGRAKKRQPDLLEVALPKKGEKRKTPSASEEKGRKEAPKAVAEFSHVGDWNHPVHLTGYLVHVGALQQKVPAQQTKSELLQLKGLFQGQETTGDDELGEIEGEEGEEGDEEGEVKEEEEEVDLRHLAEGEGEGEGDGGGEEGGEEEEEEEKEEKDKKKNTPVESEKGKKKAEQEPVAKKQKAENNKTKAKVEAPNKERKENNDAKNQTTQIIKLPSGLQYQEVKPGTGPVVKEGQVLKVRYKGLLQDGHQFDTNMPRGKPFSFRLGGSEVISGWNVGIAGMRVGGRRNLLLPPHLGYGARGSPPDIPPHAPLIFEIHLIGAK